MLWQHTLLTTLATFSLPHSPVDDAYLDTPAGIMKGFTLTSRSGRPYFAWTTIPYAQPPLGNLRLKAPVPAVRWSGVLNATCDMPSCLQSGDNRSTEDCLYLSVYRPKAVVGKLPVLFYVHGGAFTFGNVGPRRSPDYIMDENVILILPNYRLNGFGFLTLADAVLPGNFGLKDLVLALRWVKRNIEYFGGDPDSITVFGGSAGGASAHFLLQSPATTDLVARALSFDGTINHVWSLLRTEEVKRYSLQVVNDVGCTRKYSEEILRCLQQVGADTLLNAITSIPPLDFAHHFFAPVIEPRDAESAVVTEDLSLRPSNKPWISSITNGEFLEALRYELTAPKGAVESVKDHLGEYLQGVVKNHTHDPARVQHGSQALERKYFPQPDPLLNTFKRQLAMLLGDESFIYPAIFNIQQHRGPKWLEHFEYKGELAVVNNPFTDRPFSDDVAAHGDETVLYFNYRSLYPYARPMQDASDRKVSTRLIKRLTNFAYYGNPTPPGSKVQWSQFTTNQILRVTAQGDYLGNASFFRQFQDIYNLWHSAIMWR